MPPVCSLPAPQDMQQLWQGYNEDFSNITSELASLKAAADKRKASARRKVKAFQDDASAKLAEVEGKIKKFKDYSNKLPGLARVLKNFV